MALGFMAAFIAMAENSDSLKLWLNAMLEVGATTVPSHFLAFMAFLAAFMAFIVVVAFFSADVGSCSSPLTDRGHDLRCANFGCDDWARPTGCSGRNTDEELVDDVQEDDHGDEPAHPSWGQVSCDDNFHSILTRS